MLPLHEDSMHLPLQVGLTTPSWNVWSLSHRSLLSCFQFFPCQGCHQGVFRIICVKTEAPPPLCFRILACPDLPLTLEETQLSTFAIRPSLTLKRPRQPVSSACCTSVWAYSSCVTAGDLVLTPSKSWPPSICLWNLLANHITLGLTCLGPSPG